MPLAADTLLEREREVSMVDAMIEAAATGEAAVASIEGPPGIGKTRLIAQARLRAARANFTVLTARGSELERECGFGVVRQLFERLVADDPARLRRGAAAPAERIFSLAGGGDGTSADDNPSFASLHGLYWLTAHLAEDRPLMLALDDLQWSDAPSLRFMAYLRTRLEGMPILVVTGVRADERVSDGGLIEALVGEPSTVLIRPQPLSHGAVAAMVRQRLGPGADAGFCTACYRATAGNPLLTTELLKALAAEGVRPQGEQIAVIEELGH
jgi:predicted ATPase